MSKMEINEHVEYQNRMVPKQGFRVFIYSFDKEAKQVIEKLVNSWEEYQQEISTGIWFSHKEQALQKQNIVASNKPKRVSDGANSPTVFI